MGLHVYEHGRDPEVLRQFNYMELEKLASAGFFYAYAKGVNRLQT